MPFVKSNWACEPALAEDGAFEFGRAFTLRELSLKRGSQTRPCFLHGAWLIEWVDRAQREKSIDVGGESKAAHPEPTHGQPRNAVSSEAECRVKSLSLIASAEVEVLDVFALLGSLESMDYRKLGAVQGSAMEDGRVFFNVNTSQFPTMWQLQLKLSSRAQAVVVHELNVQVDRTGAGGASSLASASASAAKAPASAMADTAALYHTSRSSLGASLSNTATLRSTAAATRGLGATGATTMDFGAGTTTSSLGLSRSARATTTAAAPTGSLAASSRLDASASAAAKPKPSAAAGAGASASTTSASSALARIGARPSASASSDLALRGTTSTALSAGPGAAETAAVASVLNAVCEKMVGVVSEKTKAYLAKAGKRTERRVLGTCMCARRCPFSTHICKTTFAHPPSRHLRQDGQAGAADRALRRRAQAHHGQLLGDRGGHPGAQPGPGLAPHARRHLVVSAAVREIV